MSPVTTEELVRVRRFGLYLLRTTAVVFVLILVTCTAWVGYSAYHSESAGVRTAFYSSFPIGAGFCSLLGAIAGHYLVKTSVTAKLLISVVAGVVGGACSLAMAALFFLVIFPAL